MSTIIAPSEESRQRTNTGVMVRSTRTLAMALPAIGDIRVLQFQMLEQVSALSDAAIQVDNSTLTRTFEAEFRLSTDGTSFGSWLAFTNPMLAGLVIDANNQLYIEIRVTRTGSDASGVLVWSFAGFTATIDDQATVGRGLPSQENIHGDTIALFIAVIQSWVWQVEGGDHYHVDYKPRFWEFTTVKPTIYLHSLLQTGTSHDAISDMNRLAQISIGIKPVKGRTEGYNEQLSRLLSMFDPLNEGVVRWTFTYKGVRYIDATLADLGMRIESTSGMQEFHDQDAHVIYNEFVLSFSLSFYRFAHK